MVEVKTENPEGRVVNDFRGHGRIKILEFPKAKGIKMFMLLAVGYGYFLESHIGREKVET